MKRNRGWKNKGGARVTAPFRRLLQPSPVRLAVLNDFQFKSFVQGRKQAPADFDVMVRSNLQFDGMPLSSSIQIRPLMAWASRSCKFRGRKSGSPERSNAMVL